MKRSAAPSQIAVGGGVKRQHFVSPATIRPRPTGNDGGDGTDRSGTTFRSTPTVFKPSVVNSFTARRPENNSQLESPLASSNQRVPRLFNNVIRNRNSDTGNVVTKACRYDYDEDSVNKKLQPSNSTNKDNEQVTVHEYVNTSPDKICQEDAPAISILANNHLKKTFMCQSSQSKENVSLSDAECQHLTLECDNPDTIASGAHERNTADPFWGEVAAGHVVDGRLEQRNYCNVISDQTSSVRYFSVVWCKMSKKKHKKWEGDAVLATSGRTVTLYDMDGKVLGKGSGYKIAQLESLTEDETLFVGGKEIQVMSTLTEEYFKSGKCFTSGVESAPSSDGSRSQIRNPGISKLFTKPALKSGQANMLARDPAIAHPAASKYDPNAPNALVMPRPCADHQWKHNRLGHPVVDVVVDPYLSNYLRSHQRTGVIFLYECILGMRNYHGEGAILADDMGLGKTLQCICLIWTLLKQGPYGGNPVARKVLIVTPGSLVKNWFLEFKKWLGSERLNVFAVSTDKRVDDFVKSGLHPVLVISYEMFVRYHELIKQVHFDLIVCDEGHRLKNTAIKTTAILMSLPCRRRIVLTGTPIQNDLQEFYSIVEFVNPGILGSSSTFRHVYEDPIVASQQPKATDEERELGTKRAQELTRLTQMFVLRRTQEINNDYLPPKVEMVLFCKPTALQLNLYRQLLHSNVIRRCLAGNLSGSPHLICIGALKNLCNHPGLVYRKAAEEKLNKEAQINSIHGKAGDDSFEEWEDSVYSGLLSYFPETFDASSVNHNDSGKLMVLSGLLSAIWSQSSSEKVVLVSSHTKTLDFLEVFCQHQRYSFLRLDGQTPTVQRQDIVTRFNNKTSPFRIFLLSSKAGGVGLNLIGASRLILYDIDWNPANDLQAMARVWRDGQTGKVYIYRLITVGTIEEKMYQRQITKQGLSGAVMDVGRKSSVQFCLEDLKDLFSLNELTDCETHSMLDCPCAGDPAFVPEHTEVDVLAEDRPCQLGRLSATTQKSKSSNLTMAELSHWKHWRGEFVKDQENWCLDQVSPALSFVFWQEINAG
ncbi:hypothetical protein BsWGS_06647 [Bradybaena similaris]